LRTLRSEAIAPCSKLDPLNLADCDLILGPVVELRGPGRLMRSHLLGMLEPATVLQVNRHTGRAPSLTTVDYRAKEVGQCLARELLALIGRKVKSVKKSIRPFLVERESH
jgi:hypothetical protein